MSEFHKELLTEIVDTWGQIQLDNYIAKLEARENELTDWILRLKVIRRKLMRKTPLENGPRDGR